MGRFTHLIYPISPESASEFPWFPYCCLRKYHSDCFLLVRFVSAIPSSRAFCLDTLSNIVLTFMKQTRNLLRIAIYNISYIRGLFPDKYFNDKSVPALG
jgi:hypothetical protein